MEDMPSNEDKKKALESAISNYESLPDAMKQLCQDMNGDRRIHNTLDTYLLKEEHQLAYLAGLMQEWMGIQDVTAEAVKTKITEWNEEDKAKRPQEPTKHRTLLAATHQLSTFPGAKNMPGEYLTIEILDYLEGTGA